MKLPTSTLFPPTQEASLILTVSVVGATADQQMPQVPLPAVSGSSHHGGGAERRGSSGTERQLPLLSRWLGAGTSLSGICCNFLISSLGARRVAAQEDEMKVAVKSPKGSAFYSYSETQPSVLVFFFYLWSSRSPTWTSCCFISLMLTRAAAAVLNWNIIPVLPLPQGTAFQ